MKLFLIIASLLFTLQLFAVNINTASQKELESLNGVGPTTAKAIINYRKAHPFTTKEDVKNVRGIGQKKYETIKDDVSI